jgi:hypothetical protein
MHRWRFVATVLDCRRDLHHGDLSQSEEGTLMKDHHKIGRLAMREEGDEWKAYYAMPDTMKGAIFLGSIKMRFVMVEERKNAFMDLMREAVADLIEEQVGVAPFWEKGR